jgi:gluconate 5-dehydrogenase
MNVIDSFKLNQRVAIVTGGYGFLGKAFVESLQEAGAKVVVAGRSEEKYKEAFQNTENITFEFIDILDSKSMKQCFQNVFDKYGRIDILVNNATTLAGQFPEETTDEQLQKSWDGVIGSVYKSIREIIPFMRRQGGGAIVNIASMYGVVIPDLRMYEDSCRPYFNSPQYGAGKAAVIQLTKYFAEYLSADHIRVNAIAPGTYPKPQIAANEQFVERLSAHNPMNRIGTPDDLKGALLFLASDASKYMIGQTLQVDGGWTLW